VKDGGTASEKAAGSQDKLNASSEVYVSLLRRIHPALGNFVDSIIKGSKVAGDLAQEELSLGGVLGTVAEAVKGNAAALALIGAGGAVVLAINLVASAVRKMREDFEAATKAVKALADAQTELRKGEAGEQAAIEALRDKFKAGPFSAEQARAAAATAGDISGRPEYAFLSSDAIQQAIAAVGPRVERGGTRSLDEIVRIVTLIETGRLAIEPGKTQAAIDSRIDRALARSGDGVTAILAREAEQARELTLKAAGAAQFPGQSREAMEFFAGRRARGTAADATTVMELATIIPELRGRIERVLSLEGPEGRAKLETELREQLGRTAVFGKPFTDEEFRQAQQLVSELTTAAREMRRASEATRDAADQLKYGKQTTVNNIGRMTYPDARSQRDATNNGERRAAARDRF
jgi:hypothetical protein